MNKTIKTGKLFRTLEFDRAVADQEKRTVPLSFSSEDPVDRWFGKEILDHSSTSIRMGRINNGGPLLVDHNTRDQIGVIESTTIGPDRKGRAVVRFGKSERAEEIFNDVLDGIRRNVSVGYQIHQMVLEEEKEGNATYRATDWEPLEISIVSVPADNSVGVGREQEGDHQTKILTREVTTMEDKDKSATPAVDIAGATAKAASDARDAERHRVREMSAMGEKHPAIKELARQFIENGKSLDEFRTVAWEKMNNAVPLPSNAAEIGLSERETKNFSILRAINALANPGDVKAREAARFEFECSSAAAKKFGRDAQGIYIPMEVQKRDLTSGTTTTGGHTVSTDLLAGSFIDMLRNRLITRQMGATILGGLVGNVAIPRQGSGATAYWVAENVAPTESEPAFEQVTLAPKTVGTYTDISRKLLLQSSIDVEGLVRSDLASVMALAIDAAAINGAGTGGVPKGVLKQTGIGDVAGGTNGLAATWAHIVSLWSTTAVANADFGNTGFMTNAKVIGKLMSTLKGSSTMDFIATQFPDANGMTALAGARCGVSNQVPSTLNKGTSTGVCSAIIFGNWADLLIGQWGALDILVDPYTGGAAGTVRVRVLQDVDVAVRHADSFTAMQDALTA